MEKQIKRKSYKINLNVMDITDRKNILIIEDDDSVAEGLADILAGYGYNELKSSNASDSIQKLSDNRIDLIVLDVHLGDENGYELCKKIRMDSDIPVIFLTACNSEMELIRGFQSGGDDYVTKPFRMQELLVRIQALLRRTAKSGHEKKITGELEFDINRCHIFKNKKSVELSTTEWRIAAVLIEHYPAAVSREELLYQVWDKDAMYVEENTLNVNISRVREKLGRYDGQQYIETVRGIGYRWSVDVK